MSCNFNCKLCDRLVISQSVTFTGGNLIVNIPAGSYDDGDIYCIVIAQNIPVTTTINAPVFITIGEGAALYPLTKCDCSQTTACGLRTRTRYKTRVSTNATGGAFKLFGNLCCAPNNSLQSIDGTAPTVDEPAQIGGAFQ